MVYNRANAVDFYFSEIEAGRLNVSDIRKEMELQRHDPAEIKLVVRLVDDMVIRAEERRVNRRLGRGMFVGGLVLTLVAVLTTVLTYTGVIQIAGGTRYLVMHGLFVMGLSSLGAGWVKMTR
jgi:hypothetical protein